MTWDLVDWQTGYLHLPGTMTKNGEPRKFPFHNYPQLRTLLEQQRSLVEQLRRVYGKVVPWVFPGREGDQIRDWWKGWRAAVLRAATMQVNGKRCVRPDRLSIVRVDAGLNCWLFDGYPSSF